jgi:hypothetical protein
MSDLIHYLLSLWATLFTLMYPMVTLAQPVLTRVWIALTRDRSVRISRREYEDLLASKASLAMYVALGAEEKVCDATLNKSQRGEGR